MYEMEQIEETVILAGIDTGDGEAAERSLDELEELAKTAGAKVAGRLIQASVPALPAHTGSPAYSVVPGCQCGPEARALTPAGLLPVPGVGWCACGETMPTGLR